MQPHLLGEGQLATIATSARKWQKSLACAASVADVICLQALRCRRSSAERTARLLSLAASGGSRSRWREGAWGAVLEHPSEARSAEVRAPIFVARSASAFSAASAEPTPPLLDGLARRSLAPPPGRGAQRREHRRRVRRRVRERRDRPFSDRA
jgi:hypothetical protein